MALAAGSSGCRPAATPGGQGGAGRSDAAVQGSDELFHYAVTNLNRLEDFDVGELQEQLSTRITAIGRGEQLPPGEQADPLRASWPEPEMLGQIVSRLNQWCEAQGPVADWRPEPMLAALPTSLAELPMLRRLDSMQFSSYDGFCLLETAWLRDVSNWARGKQADELQQARNLFDWTVRNIQLDLDRPERTPQVPWETLLLGRGSALERAWVFVLLLRQQGIDAAMLALPLGPPQSPDTAPVPSHSQNAGDSPKQPENDSKQSGNDRRQESVAKGSGKDRRQENPAKGSGKERGQENPAKGSGKERGQESPADLTDTHLRPWCVAVAIHGGAGGLYLFDLALGLPIPARDGVRLARGGQLDIQPATLEQVLADRSLLDRLDLEAAPYWAKEADLGHVVVLVEASPIYLTKRAKLLESRLVGKDKMVLTTAATEQAERLKVAAHARLARLWGLPYHTLERRRQLSPPDVRRWLEAFLPLFATARPLYKGRVLHLKGRFGEQGAIDCYYAARPTDEALAADEQKRWDAYYQKNLLPQINSLPPDKQEEAEQQLRQQALAAIRWETAVYRRAKLDASYWLGLIAFEQGNYRSAIDWFANRTLAAVPTGPWTPAARYNLGRSHEAAGQAQAAVEEYAVGSFSPLVYGNLLRARWLHDLTAKK
jgi:hypothetical protein